MFQQADWKGLQLFYIVIPANEVLGFRSGWKTWFVIFDKKNQNMSIVNNLL